MFEKFNLGNLSSLMKGAKKIQEAIQKNQEELAKTEVTAESGAGLVKVTLNGLYAIKHLELGDELLSEPKEIIQDLIIAAINMATQKIGKINQGKMADITQFLGGMEE